MDCEKVPSLLVVRISPTARSGDCETTQTAQGLGHLLASVQAPMEVAASTGSIGPRRIATPAFRSIRIRHEHTFSLGPHNVCFGAQALQSFFVK